MSDDTGTDNTSGNNTAEILAQLRDIHLPAAPPEPAIWPIVLALALVAVMIGKWLHKYLLRDRRQQIAYTLAELDKIESCSPPDETTQVATLLKRLTLSLDPQTRQLSGDEWLTYLDGFFATQYFSAGGGQTFGDALYTPDGNAALQSDDYAKLRRLIRKRLWRA